MACAPLSPTKPEICSKICFCACSWPNHIPAMAILNRLMEKKEAEITAIKAENEALNARLAALEQMMQQALGQQGQAQPGKRQR